MMEDTAGAGVQMDGARTWPEVQHNAGPLRAESLVQTLRRKLSGYRAKTHKLDVCTNLVHFFT